MYRRWQLWLGVSALALAALLFATSSASAQHWGHGGYYGSGYYGNPYYGAYGPYRSNWYGRSYYGNPYSGWNSGYYSNSYADYEPNYYYGQQPYYQQQGYTSFYQQEQMPQNAAMVHVRLPADAELWFGDDKTNQTGSERDFVSPELKEDKDYFYTLKARWTDQNGKEVERTQRVTVHRGAQAQVDFNKSLPQNPPKAERTKPPVEQNTPTPEPSTPTTKPPVEQKTPTPEPSNPTTNPPPVRTNPPPSNNKP
jgi:uncharacterized protein (TIGR03000 family)